MMCMVSILYSFSAAGLSCLRLCCGFSRLPAALFGEGLLGFGYHIGALIISVATSRSRSAYSHVSHRAIE